MEYNLDAYGGKYTPQWVIKHLTKAKLITKGKRQWYLCGFSIGSVEVNDKDIEKYVVTRVVDALNKENNFGELLSLREYWRGGQVKSRMDQEIKEGAYSLSRRMRYTSSKKFTGFYDENDPTFIIPIPAEKLEDIAEMVGYGVPYERIHSIMGLECSLAEFCKYIQLNRDGKLDDAFKHIAHKSRTPEGFIEYVRPDVAPLMDKHIDDFKIKIGDE